MGAAGCVQGIDQFREHIEQEYLTYCDKGVPLNCVTAAITCLILAKSKLAVCPSRRDRKLVMPVRSKYRKVLRMFATLLPDCDTRQLVAPLEGCTYRDGFAFLKTRTG
ncbi:hypothetical protein GB937_001828, partial [Aspergillus fischeri]